MRHDIEDVEHAIRAGFFAAGRARDVARTSAR
jgi:hypothetical protein